MLSTENSVEVSLWLNKSWRAWSASEKILRSFRYLLRVAVWRMTIEFLATSCYLCVAQNCKTNCQKTMRMEFYHLSYSRAVEQLKIITCFKGFSYHLLNRMFIGFLLPIKLENSSSIDRDILMITRNLKFHHLIQQSKFVLQVNEVVILICSMFRTGANSPFFSSSCPRFVCLCSFSASHERSAF